MKLIHGSLVIFETKSCNMHQPQPSTSAQANSIHIKPFEKPKMHHQAATSLQIPPGRDEYDSLLPPAIRRKDVAARGQQRRTFRESVLRIGEIQGHSGNRPYNFFMDTIVALVTVLEISLVLYLAFHHFAEKKENGLIALAMLLPILLNFVGGTYFLSDPEERQELEKCGRPCKCAADFLQFPILGPVFTAIRVLSISAGCSTHTNYERLEASAVKMRQAVGFFTAAPEATVQLSVLLVQTTKPLTLEFDSTNLEIFAVLLFTITLAESNCYNPLSDYYKMFVSHKASDWHLGEVELWKKVLLFLHAFCSIGSRIVAVAMLNAAAIYVCTRMGFTDIPLVIVLVFLTQVLYKLAFHYVCQLIYFCKTTKEVPSGCYESINYAWRSTVLNYGFQSENVYVQLFFYIENAVFYGAWVYAIQNFAEKAIVDTLKYVMTNIELALLVLSVLLLIICAKCNLIKVQNPFTPSPNNRFRY